MHLSDLKNFHVTELVEMAIANEIDGANRLRKQDLIFALLKNQAQKGRDDFRRRHAGGAAGRLRFPAFTGYLVSGRARRHLRLAHRKSAASTCTREIR